MGFNEDVMQNLALNKKELIEKRKILSSYPIKIFIEPTQRCNLNCIMCHPNRRTIKSDMCMTLFNKIEKELFAHVAEVNFFINGESTLAPNFEKMILTSKRYSFLPKLYTNANAIPEKIMELLVRLGFFVTISIDAADKELYEKIRRGANYDALIKNIKKFMLLKKKLGNDRFHIRFGCTMGVMNINQAVKLVELAHDLGVKDIHFGAMDYGISSPMHLTVDKYKAISYFKEAKELADKYKIRFSCPRRIGGVIIDDNHNWNDFPLGIDKFAPFQLEEFNPYCGDCGYPWAHFLIRSNGIVCSCCQRQHIMGDLNKNSFWEIWNDKKYQLLRSQDSFYDCMGKKCNMAIYSIYKGEKVR